MNFGSSAAPGAASVQALSRGTLDVILFVVGGVSYEESAAVNAFNARHPNVRVVLGGTHVHNSESYAFLLYFLFW